MANKNATKRALTMSVISMLICIVMLMGTTFAWFTDSVVSGKNTIVAGNLDVELEYSKDLVSWKSVEGMTDLFDVNALWEPGHTEVIYLRVRNLGTLALQYQFSTTFENTVIGKSVLGNDIELSDYLEYGIKEGVTAKYATREAARADVTGVPLDAYTMAGKLEAKQTSAPIAYVVYMPETVGNEANHVTGTDAPVVELGVNLVATQVEHENDSFGIDYDANAYVEYTYDSTKSAKENAAALQALIDTADEGSIISVTPGTYDVSGISGNQIKLTKDNVMLLGRSGVIINDDGEAGSTNATNTQAVIKITGDNVTVSNIYATDKGTNTVILAFGKNVTIKSCPLKGYADPTWGQYLEAGVMIVTNDVVNAPITKYTLTNNTFIDCNVSLQNGVGNGGDAKDLIISGNTFKNAGVFVEHNQTNAVTGAYESWHVTDILVLPTIENNLFKSPSVWLSGSTPFAMYLRVYRDNDVATMTPASYWTDFVANNTIMDYTGERVSTDGTAALIGENGVQMRPNGKVQYYGLNFGSVASDVASLTAALANGESVYLTADINANEDTFTVPAGTSALLDLGGHTVSGVDNTTGAYGLFTVNAGASLTINDSTGGGVITTSATIDSGWNRRSCAVSNERGTVIINGGTIEHKGGTAMSYAIDNLTNGKNTFAKTVVNDGNLISSYIGIRQFCNGEEADNIVEINGGTITGSKRSVWMQDPSAKANTGTLTINDGTFNSPVLIGNDRFVVTIADSFNVVKGESGLTLTAK